MIRACACIVAALLAAGCGQRGPLYLPAPLPPVSARPAGAAQATVPATPAPAPIPAGSGPAAPATGAPLPGVNLPESPYEPGGLPRSDREDAVETGGGSARRR